MGRLTTHVLDTASGKPAAGLTIELRRLCADGKHWTDLATKVTNADGRVDAPFLEGETMEVGTYELRFHAGDYLKASGAPGLADPLFLDIIPLRFAIADPQAHYHVPLLLSPFGYSTYRGS
ncbi:hydroxyisourate hydrolase [Roseibium aestuarii]|uniref:5-hydroxyisourate hydrolase n=1 Tax=Roseibium aestuarii TaxID=2600299 RepID=A0ABW4JUC0_9HYPH|nr:hydroxyisourate hydrolase [Roseibium aestuarii]